MRAHLFDRKLIADERFRWRGGDVSRLEAFADGIFAVTITLLIISSSSSYGFYDMWLMVRDLPAFLLSFAMICYAWIEHYLFFRRYGLADSWTLFFNALFLFLVMVLAYPLKLLSVFLWHIIIGEPTQPLFFFPEDATIQFTIFEQRVYMMYFYSAAIIGVFSTLFFMHFNAYRKRKALELDQLELLTTIQSMSGQLISVLVAICSCLVLKITQNPGISGIVYFSMPILHFSAAAYYRHQFKKLETKA